MNTDRRDSAWSRTQHIPGLTYKRLDYWCFKGYIHVQDEGGQPEGEGRAIGQGARRTITDDEICVLGFMMQLVSAGLTPVKAEPVARALAAGKVGSLDGFRIEAVA